jgi:glutathione S-transferase
MVKLYGFPLSNYFNKVRLVLLEKEVPHELDKLCFPSQDPAFRQRSPMGKVPFLETEDGVVFESQVICDYLEERFPEKPLYPKDAFSRAKVREILQTLELHVELVARRLFPEVLGLGKASDETKKEVQAGMKKGVQALVSLAKFGPYIAGPELTLADCAALFHLPLASLACKAVLGEDPLAGVPQLPGYLALMQSRPAAQIVLADQQAAYAARFGASKSS